jgi:hypothetical protein
MAARPEPVSMIGPESPGFSIMPDSIGGNEWIAATRVKQDRRTD